MLRLVIEVHALALKNDVDVFDTDVCEANKHALPAIHCLDYVMTTEDDIVENSAIWR